MREKWAIIKMIMFQLIVLYYLETWEAKDGRDGGRRVAEALLSTIGQHDSCSCFFLLLVTAVVSLVVG